MNIIAYFGDFVQKHFMNSSLDTPLDTRQMRRQLLTWYDEQGRELPWRIRPLAREKGVIADPYKVWLSEIMCQQTTVTAAIPYWQAFLQKWPNVESLAAAPLDDVLSVWAGLGYYARARNLHKCAGIIMDEHGGVFPKDEAQLLTLPGIGRYTAAAMAAICYGAPANVVDGNVERVMSRLYAVQAALPKAKGEFYKRAGAFIDKDRAQDYPQALMDLGAVVCRPKSPKCALCPWGEHCAAFREGNADQYPKRAPKRARPKRFGAVFYIENNGEVFLQKRPDQGLLGGMSELPGTEWTLEKPDIEQWLACAPVQTRWRKNPKPIKHVFTHFELELCVFTARGHIDHPFAQPAQFVSLDDLQSQPLPSLMHKAIRSAQEFTWPHAEET